MANKERGIVEIVLDKPRTIRFDCNAMIEVEGILGINTFDLLGMPLDLTKTRAFVWAGLLHADEKYQKEGIPSLSIQDVTKHITFANMYTLAAQVEQALVEAFPEPDPKNEGSGPEAEEKAVDKKAGTGKRSNA
jgi:hypothetical protein